MYGKTPDVRTTGTGDDTGAVGHGSGASESGGGDGRVPIQTKQDWSGANRFNAWDSSVSKPKAGYIGNYYLFGHGDGSLSALIVAKDVVHLERYDRLGSVSANGGTFSDGSTTVEITYDYCYFTEPPDFPTLERYVFDG